MSGRSSSSHRRSVSLVPQTKQYVENISAKEGVSGNRAIEKALEFYSKTLNLKEDGQIVSFTIRKSDGKEQSVAVLM